MHLSIIVPLYNEADFIIQVLELLSEVKFPEFVQELEIVIVDDCSIDNSYDLVKEYALTHPQVKCIRHSQNMGKGAAVKSGIRMSKGDVYFIQDADLELSPRDIPRMLNTMYQLKVEFVNGSRYMPGIDRPISSYKRYVANRFFTFLTSLLIDVKLTDMACGYKLFHKNLWDKLEIRENRFAFEAELIIKSLRIRKNNIAEIPVQYFPRNEGEGKKLKAWMGLKYWELSLNMDF